MGLLQDKVKSQAESLQSISAVGKGGILQMRGTQHAQNVCVPASTEYLLILPVLCKLILSLKGFPH